MAAMMEACAKFASPGAGHERFKKLEGRWSATVKFWLDPSGDPSEGAGFSEFRLLLGGRFLQQEYKGEAMGQPFEGMGITGFDNFREEYVDFWMDTMSTGVMMSRGQAEKSGETVNFNGTMDSPGMGLKDIPIRSVARFDDDDTHVLQMFSPGPDGREFQNMEIIYKRQK
jgi:hypothetical protein